MKNRLLYSILFGFVLSYLVSVPNILFESIYLPNKIIVPTLFIFLAPIIYWVVSANPVLKNEAIFKGLFYSVGVGLLYIILFMFYNIIWGAQHDFNEIVSITI